MQARCSREKFILPNNTIVCLYGGAFTVILKSSSKKSTELAIGKIRFKSEDFILQVDIQH